MEVIESKILGITSEYVLVETDIKVLMEWKRVLKLNISEMKGRIITYRKVLEDRRDEELYSKFIRTSDAKNYAVAFLDIINTRIRELRGTLNKPKSTNFGKYCDYLKAFRKLVKNEISDELFEKLDNRAKEITGFEKI